jgi:hypothetical protein
VIILLVASQRVGHAPYNYVVAVIGGADIITVTRTFFYKSHISEAMLKLDSVNNMYLRV